MSLCVVSTVVIVPRHAVCACMCVYVCVHVCVCHCMLLQIELTVLWKRAISLWTLAVRARSLMRLDLHCHVHHPNDQDGSRVIIINHTKIN